MKREEEKKAPWKSDISRLDESFGPLKRSSFDLTEIGSRLWQAHCKRIADYLATGKEKWWTRKGNIIEFHDGDEDPDTLLEGPALMEFVHHTYQSSQAVVNACWEKCVSEPQILPLFNVTLFDVEGNFVENVEVMNPENSPAQNDQDG